MKSQFLGLLSISLFCCSCITTKQINQDVTNKNYDTAIEKIVYKLPYINSLKKRKIYDDILITTYEKAQLKDLEKIYFLENLNYHINQKDIIETFQKIDTRRKTIVAFSPISPDSYKDEERSFLKKSDSIINLQKKRIGETLYTTALQKLKHPNDKIGYRQIHKQLKNAHYLYSDLKHIDSLIDLCETKGKAYFLINLKSNYSQQTTQNISNSIAPKGYFTLNEIWNEFHTEENTNINFEYEIDLEILDLDISDNLSNEVDRFYDKKVTHEDDSSVPKGSEVIKSYNYYEYNQWKTCELLVRVNVVDLKANEVIDNFNIKSGSTFEHQYIRDEGNSTLLGSIIDLVSKKTEAYPSEQKMISNAAKDFQIKFSDTMKSRLR